MTSETVCKIFPEWSEISYFFQTSELIIWKLKISEMFFFPTKLSSFYSWIKIDKNQNLAEYFPSWDNFARMGLSWIDEFFRKKKN